MLVHMRYLCVMVHTDTQQCYSRALLTVHIELCSAAARSYSVQLAWCVDAVVERLLSIESDKSF
jgi:hypothetical protein